MSIPTVGKWDVGEGLANIGDTIFKMLHPDYAQAALTSDQILANPAIAQQFADQLYLGGRLPPLHRKAFEMVSGMPASVSARVERTRRGVLDGQPVSEEDQATLRDILLQGNQPFGALTGAASRERIAAVRNESARQATNARLEIAGRRLEQGQNQFVETLRFRRERAGADDQWRREQIRLKEAGLEILRHRAETARQSGNQALINDLVTNIGVPLPQATAYVTNGTDPDGSVTSAIIAKGSRGYFRDANQSVENLISATARLQSENLDGQDEALALNAANGAMLLANTAYRRITREPLFEEGGRIVKNVRWGWLPDKYVWVDSRNGNPVPLHNMLSRARLVSMNLLANAPDEAGNVPVNPTRFTAPADTIPSSAPSSITPATGGAPISAPSATPPSDTSRPATPAARDTTPAAPVVNPPYTAADTAGALPGQSPARTKGMNDQIKEMRDNPNANWTKAGLMQIGWRPIEADTMLARAARR